MDGHTAHINLAVSDFCRDNGIILYCFPAHSSHILQPLDISVFGPLKKEWNKQIELFKRDFNMALTKTNFFKVFDHAWKASTKAENAIAGFRSAGLLPFNANNVDYRKVMDHNAVSKWEQTSSSVKRSEGEKVGIAICLSIFEDLVSEDDVRQFHTRIEEGYNVTVHSFYGKLFTLYKRMREALNGDTTTHDTTNIQLELNTTRDSMPNSEILHVYEFSNTDDNMTNTNNNSSSVFLFTGPERSSSVSDETNGIATTYIQDHSTPSSKLHPELCFPSVPTTADSTAIENISASTSNENVFSVASSSPYSTLPVSSHPNLKQIDAIPTNSLDGRYSSSLVVTETVDLNDAVVTFPLPVLDSIASTGSFQASPINPQNPSFPPIVLLSNPEISIESLPDTVNTNVSTTEVNFPPPIRNPVSSSSVQPVPASTSYSYMNSSPFKNCLKISESLIIKREKTRSSGKMPSAISGVQAREILADVQTKKQKEIELKEKRKEERERKKLLKEEAMKSKKKNPRKKRNVASSDSDQEDSATTIVYNDSSCSDAEDLNICYACFGDEHWNENEK